MDEEARRANNDAHTYSREFDSVLVHQMQATVHGQQLEDLDRLYGHTQCSQAHYCR